MAEVRETYRRRKDCLLERRAQPKEAMVFEVFALGAVNALRSIRASRGRKITEFESSARADGLVRRDEQACCVVISYPNHILLRAHQLWLSSRDCFRICSRCAQHLVYISLASLPFNTHRALRMCS